MAFLSRLIVVITLIFAFSHGNARAAASIQTQVLDKGKFTRISFQSQSDINSSLNGNRLQIDFKEPVNDVVLSAIKSGLGEKASAASLVNNGRRISITLAGNYRLRSFVTSDGRGIDLVKTDDKIESQPQEQKPIKEAKEAEETKKPEAPSTPPAKTVSTTSLKVNAELVKDFTRVTFEWSEPVKYRVNKQDTRVSIVFDRNIPEPPTLQSPGGDIIKVVKISRHDGNLAYDFMTFEDVKITHFKEKKKIILELHLKNPKPKEEKPEQKKEEKKEEKTAEASPTDSKIAEEKKLPKEIKETQKPETPPATAKAETPPPAPEPTPESPSQKIKAKTFSIDPTPYSFDLTFAFKSPVGAAAFVHGNYLWLVFDKPFTYKPEGEDNLETSKFIGNYLVAGDSNFTAIGFERKSLFNLTARTEGAAWIFSLYESPQNLVAEPVRIIPYIDKAKRGTISVEGQAAGLITRRLSFTDPFTGEPLIVFTSSSAALGIPETRGFVDLTLLKSNPGIAAVLHNDSLKAENTVRAVSFTSPQGLTVTPNLPESNKTAGVSASGAQSLFPLAEWKLPENTDLRAFRRQVTNAINSTKGEATTLWRVRLAAAYEATGQSSEALGLINNAEAEDPSAVSSERLLQVKAAALIDQEKFADAAATLSSPPLSANPQSAKVVQIITSKEDTTNFSDALNTDFASYPQSVILKLGMKHAENALAAANHDEALRTLDALDKASLLTSSQIARNKSQLLLAKAYSGKGEQAKAEEIYSTLANDLNNREGRAAALYNMTVQQLEGGKISRAEAIAKLESLAHVWREQDFEAMLLSKLADLYLLEQQFPKALDTWRYLTSSYPDSPLAADASKKMTDTFIFLFNKGGAEQFPPLEALTLYYEYRDLTPAGKDGDEMIQNLADRLFSVELLDRSAALLTHQVRFRLQDAERARVGTRLALIHLLSQKPDLAIEVLDFSEFADIPPELAERRRHLRAQALLDLGKLDEALEALGEDTSENAVSLRLEILWKKQGWKEVAAFLEKILKDREGDQKPLSPQEAERAIRLGFSYVFLNDEKALANLKLRFINLIDDKKMKDAFTFITDNADILDHTNFERASNIIGSFESFMDGFKKEVQEQGLSETIN